MRKLFHTTVALSVLLATSMAANAADVPPYAPPPPVYAPPVYAPPPLWTGFYLGGNIGGAWANRDVTDTFLGANFNTGDNNGVFIGGGQLGFNWQVSNFVLGGASSRSDRHAGGPAQVARGLLRTVLCHCRRPDLLRAGFS